MEQKKDEKAPSTPGNKFLATALLQLLVMDLVQIYAMQTFVSQHILMYCMQHISLQKSFTESTDV